MIRASYALFALLVLLAVLCMPSKQEGPESDLGA